MAALSPAAPTRPIDPTRWLTARARTYFLDRNWLDSTGGRNTGLLEQQ